MIKELFKYPPKEYSLVPLWFWNDELDPEHLKWQMRCMEEKGIYETIISSRLGIEIPYLSELWFERITEIVQYAKEIGMKIWLYDEDNWPSGYAGGKVLQENPNYCGKHLKKLEIEVDGEDWELQLELPVLCAFKKEESFLRVDHERDRVEAGAKLIVFCQDYTHWNPAYSKGYYTDMLNKEATICFMKHTHDVYKERLSDYFGSVIKGFFVDEPGFYNNLHLQNILDDNTVAWTDNFPQYFQRRNGYDILALLPYLWEEIDQSKKQIRIDFYETLCDMYKENFLDVLRAFCEKNGMELIGHLHYEEFMQKHITTQGNYMRALGSLSVTGLDRIDMNPEKIAEKYASSAAHQYGSRRVLSETYALSGWNLNIQEMKRWIDYQYVRGVNMLVPHAFYASIEGARNQECPPSEFYQNPYWKYFGQFSKYAHRMSYLMSQGIHQCHAALYYPIHTMQSLYTPQSNKRVSEKDEEFQKLAMGLLEHQIDYDIITRECLLDAVTESDGRIRIGQENYGTIIFAQEECFDSKVANVVKGFINRGGKVVFTDGLPEQFLEYKENKLVLAISQNRVYKSFTYTRYIAPILHFMMEHNQIDLYLPEKDTQIKYLHRVINGQNFYFVTNEDGYKKEICLEIQGDFGAEEWNPENGEVRLIPSHVKKYEKRYMGTTPNGGEWIADRKTMFTECRINLAEYGSVLLCLIESDKKIKRENHAITWISAADAWKIDTGNQQFESDMLNLEAGAEEYFSGTFSGTVRMYIPEMVHYSKAFFVAEKVKDCMEVVINGKNCGFRSYAPFEVEITDALHRGENEVTVMITNTMLYSLRKLHQQGGILGKAGIRLEE